jgi:hypothetical protein
MTGADITALIKKHPIGIGCGVLSLLLAAGIYYRSGEGPDAEDKLTQMTDEGERYAANLKNATQLKEQFEALVVANKEIDRRLFHAGQNLTNYQYFYQLQSESGVKLTVLNQNTAAAVKPSGKNAFTPIGFSVTVQGSLAQLLDFLRRLESGAHYCRVLTATCASSPTGSLTLTLSLEVLGLP